MKLPIPCPNCHHWTIPDTACPHCEQHDNPLSAVAKVQVYRSPEGELFETREEVVAKALQNRMGYLHRAEALTLVEHRKELIRMLQWVDEE